MMFVMIGMIKGIIIDKESEGAVVDVNGVGYQVFLPLNTLASLPSLNSETTLFIHTHVREDDIRLFGFATKQDRTVFRTLTKISGIGPKVALAVLGALGGKQLIEAVQTADVKRMTSIPGIGKKTAERMLLELGGKLDFDKAEDGAAGKPSVYQELDGALKNLGFKGPVVQKVLKRIEADHKGEGDFPALLKKALAALQEG